MLLKTLSNALALLDYFTPATPSWGVRDLARASNIHPAIIQRMLATFSDQGFLRQDPDSKKYWLGLRLFELGQQVRKRLDLNGAIRPLMEDLAQTTGETVFLTLLDHQQGVCIEIAESSRSIKYSVEVGHRYDLYLGSHNKVILAYLDPVERERILRLPQSPFRARYKQQAALLDEIREQGWCSSQGEYDGQTFGVAVPLLCPENKILGSLGIAGPIFRFHAETAEKQAKALLGGQAQAQRTLYNILSL